MAWFIIQCERKTWTKYIVEAGNEEAAMGDSDNWQYLGYVDGDDTESTVVGGPFDGDLEALGDVTSYVEGQ